MSYMEALKEVRESVGMTVAELAEAAGVSRQYVYALEAGRRDNPSKDIRLRIATALDVPPYAIAR